MEKLTSEEISSKTIIYTILKAAMPVAEMIVSIIAMAVISKVFKDGFNIIGAAIWLVITVVAAFAIDFLVGYKFRAAHAAAVMDAVTVGMISEDMQSTANELVQFRFPSCNEYLGYRLKVVGALGQLQKKVNTFAEHRMNHPVFGKLISFAQTFIGMALSFTYDLILAYTFWRDGKPLHTSASDALAIYYYRWTSIVDGIIKVALMLMGIVAAAFFGVFAFTAPVFTQSFGSILAGGLMAAGCGVFAARAVKVFFESSYMIKCMPAYLEEAKYLELNDEEYGVVCRASSKFRKIYAIAAREPKDAPAPAAAQNRNE